MAVTNPWADLNSSKINLSELGNAQYRYFLEDWKQLLDTGEGGQREVKEAGQTYLPKTSGMESNTKGDDIYNAYKLRTVFYDYTKDTIIAMLGVMNAKPASFELPTSIQALDADSETPESWRVGLKQVLREINRNQILYGRYGLLADMPQSDIPAITGDVKPKIIAYEGFAILDWGTRELANGDVIIDYVLLAEVKPNDDRKARMPESEIRLRVLALDADQEYFSLIIDYAKDNEALDQLKELDLNMPPEDAIYPQQGGKKINFIPFVFINVSDLHPDIQKSSILTLSNADISIYRGDADYAQAYFMQGQATPTFTGVAKTDNLLFGAGSIITLSDKDAKATMLEVSGNGLEGMRLRQEGLHRYAASLGVALVDQNQPESGKALEIRSNIKSAPLATIAETGAKGLLQALRYAHFWKTGKMPAEKELAVTPNMDFSTATRAAKELLDLFQAKLAGAPISERDVHKFARDNNFSTKAYEETLTDIGSEG